MNASYLYVAAIFIGLMLLFKPGRAALAAAISFLWKSVLPFLKSLFALLIHAHVDLLKNLMPRKLVIKSLDADSVTTRKVEEK